MTVPTVIIGPRAGYKSQNQAAFDAAANLLTDHGDTAFSSLTFGLDGLTEFTGLLREKPLIILLPGVGLDQAAGMFAELARLYGSTVTDLAEHLRPPGREGRNPLCRSDQAVRFALAGYVPGDGFGTSTDQDGVTWYEVTPPWGYPGGQVRWNSDAIRDY